MPRKPQITAAAVHPHLKPGAKVEVRSDEPGYIGSWFSGSVIELVSSENGNPPKFLIQYTDLFEDEYGKKHLEEVIEAKNLRPPTPREKTRKFRFSENVDAFYNDGWWEGVISEELGNGRFVVFFRLTRELIEFGEEKLRLHRDWNYGFWKPPLEKENEEDNVNGGIDSNKPVNGKKFIKGTRVEVRSNEEGFEGSWYSAVIVDFLGKNNYLVQYETLRTDDGRDFLKGVADTTHIRPYPPDILVPDFKKLEKVDVWYNDGWWEGEVSSVLNNSAYTVYFPTTSEEWLLEHSQLRLHQDWINGKWVVSSSSQLQPSRNVNHLTLKLKKRSNVLAAGSTTLLVPEAVLLRKVMKQKNKPLTMWLIQWKGWTANEATWESRDEILQRYPYFDP